MQLSANTCLKYVLILIEVQCLVGETVPAFLRNSPQYVKEIYRLKTVSQFIEYYGYRAEAYNVQTEDGYILALDRMLNPKGKPVLIVHGIQLTALTWVIMGPKYALPFLLHDQGYDVWMATTRGADTSRKHVSLNPDTDAEFWNFSFHELGLYDLPAFIDFILQKTNQQQLTYIGHSQGCSAFFVLTSLKPQYNSKISFMHALSPAVYFDHSTSIVFSIGILQPLTFQYPFLGEISIPYLGLTKFCLISDGFQKLCGTILASIFGDDFTNLSEEMLPIFYLKLYNIASLRQYIHFLQVQRTGIFAFFNDGYWLGNASRFQPYPLAKVTVPIALYYGKNDYLVTPQDTERLSKELSNVVENYLVPFAKWNHVDSLLGLNAREKLYLHMLKLQKRYEN